jgi:hypothetical protein
VASVACHLGKRGEKLEVAAAFHGLFYFFTLQKINGFGV